MNKKLYLADIGASGGIHKRWRRSLCPVHSYLFEPDVEAAAELKPAIDATVFPFALGEQDELAPFYMTKEDCSGSSLLAPNLKLLRRWPNSERFETGEVGTIKTRTLDSLAAEKAFQSLDMIKLDTQGAELAILSKSVSVLPRVIGLEVEVSFIEIYQKQPVFRDVDAFLAEQGFELFDLRRVWWQRKSPRYCTQARGQLAFGDALYFRSPEAVAKLAVNDHRLAAAAFSIYDCYGYYDLCEQLLSYVNIFDPQDAAFLQQYLARKWCSRVPRLPFERRIENLFLKALELLFQRTSARHDKIVGNKIFD